MAFWDFFWPLWAKLKMNLFGLFGFGFLTGLGRGFFLFGVFFFVLFLFLFVCTFVRFFFFLGEFFPLGTKDFEKSSSVGFRVLLFGLFHHFGVADVSEIGAEGSFIFHEKTIIKLFELVTNILNFFK